MFGGSTIRGSRLPLVALLGGVVVVAAWTGAPAPSPADKPPILPVAQTLAAASVRPDELLARIEAAFQRGEISAAAAAATQLTKAEPSSARGHRLLGYLHASLGAEPDAERDFRKAAALDPSLRVSVADYHMARAWAEIQNELRRRPPDLDMAERLRALAAVAEFNPELKMLLRRDASDTDTDAELVPPIVLTEAAGNALIVEKRTQTARLYSYRGNRLVAEQTYPVTTGQAPGRKERRGDRRTPDGVYAITGLLPGKQLPDLYGDLAMPLSYPNAWDKRGGRDGYGIWIHGADRISAPFSPRETKGCVVMRSEDLRELAGLIKPQVTPIWIAEEVPYRRASEWKYTLDYLFEHISADGLLAVIAAPDYTVVFRRDGNDVAREFRHPTRPWEVIATEHVAALTPQDWQRQLSILKPEAVQQLVKVNVLDDGEFPAIVIETTGPTDVRGFQPEAAYRFYVDLPGVRPGAAPETVSGKGALVKEIRIAATEIEPPTTRLVVDLRKPGSYRLKQDGNHTIVSLRTE